MLPAVQRVEFGSVMPVISKSWVDKLVLLETTTSCRFIDLCPVMGILKILKHREDTWIFIIQKDTIKAR